MTKMLMAFISSLLFAVGLSGCAGKHLMPSPTSPSPMETSQMTVSKTEFHKEVTRLVDKFGDWLLRSRYMEDQCENATFPGWEGFPLERCTYTVHDKATGADKTATVIMLNAPPEKIARWIVRTCLEVKGGIDPAATDKLFEHIIRQSGGQFPVSGVVYEDIIPADGLYEIYCFRDGVTVMIEGVPHRETKPMTPAQIEASLTGKVTKVFRYGRIQSTTPGQYIRSGGTRDVGTDEERTPEWMNTIRESYQAAWTSDYNSLMIAWARENL